MRVENSEELYWLEQVQPADRTLLGDKAFYLGTLLQRGYPVVPGFVISARVFRRFLKTINWLEPLFADLPDSSLHLDVDNSRQLQAIAQQIRQAIEAAPLWDEWLAQVETMAQRWNNTRVILRPSFALQSGLDPAVSTRIRGLLASQICDANQAAIAHALRHVWAELFRAKSLLYWQRARIQLHQINLGVLVQPMQTAIASGDLSISPTQFTVRSIWGLGAGLVNGEIAPDLHQIHAATGHIQEQHLGNKTHAYGLADLVPSVRWNHPLQLELIDPQLQQQYALTESHLHQLIDLAQRLRSELGNFLDVEWAAITTDRDDIGILQITQFNPQFVAEPQPEAPEALEPTVQLTTQAIAADLEGRSTLVANGTAAASGQILTRVWVVDENYPELTDIPPGWVLVARSIHPDWLPQIRQAAGLITEQGGMTSHAAILARELNMPAVVGVSQITQLLTTGEVICLDGDRGTVYRVGTDILPEVPTRSQFQGSTNLPAQNATRLMVNLSQPEALSQIANLPVDGIGLLRAEHLLADLLPTQQNRSTLASLEELSYWITQRLQPFAEALAPRPVYYRSLDVRSHEFSHLANHSPSSPEANPILGLHGTFSYHLKPDLFRAELAALRELQQSGYGNVQLLLPFVRSVEEFRFCRNQVMQAGLTENPNFQLWIMAEVPSVLFLLPDYVAAGVQGISIGTNDLTQLLLAVDRDHPQMAEAYDDAHPAVLRAVRHLIEAATQTGIPCSICGEAPAQHPEIIPDLLRWGVTSISVSPGVVERTYRAIAQAEQALVLEAARQMLVGEG